MSFGNLMTPDQLKILQERYTPIKDDKPVSKCLHKSCSECNGTGIRKDGLGMCFHAISCPCPECNFTC